MNPFFEIIEENKTNFIAIIFSSLILLMLCFWLPIKRSCGPVYNYRLSPEEWERQKKMNTLIELFKLRNNIK